MLRMTDKKNTQITCSVILNKLGKEVEISGNKGKQRDNLLSGTN